jgi:hypothetical protein
MPHHAPSRHAPPLVLAFALSSALVACQPATAPAADAATTAAPAAALAQTPAAAPAEGDALARYLQSIYGDDARADGEWTGIPTDATWRMQSGETAPGTVTRRVCEREDMTLAGGRVLLVAVCGTPREYGHATQGLTDLFVLQQQAGNWTARARGHFEQFGSMGSSGEVEAERLGADLAGFVVESGFTGQGQTIAHHTVLLPRDGRFHEAATFLARMDDDVLREGCDAAAGTCPPGQAYDLDFDLDIDDGNPAAAAYPLVVEEAGNACGRPIDARHVLPLDPATLTYRVPAALTREQAC